MTATHATVTGFIARNEHVGHKLYMDSFVLSPVLFADSHTETIKIGFQRGFEREVKSKMFKRGFRGRCH
jgi:hypothetical protein